LEGPHYTADARANNRCGASCFETAPLRAASSAWGEKKTSSSWGAARSPPKGRVSKDEVRRELG